VCVEFDRIKEKLRERRSQWSLLWQWLWVRRFFLTFSYYLLVT